MSRFLHFFSGLFFLFFLGLGHPSSAQKNETVVKNAYQKFTYPNGKPSSEGIIRDGKPDGYWKSYYEDGKLKWIRYGNFIMKTESLSWR